MKGNENKEGNDVKEEEEERKVPQGNVENMRKRNDRATCICEKEA